MLKRVYHTKLEVVGVLSHMGVLPHPTLQTGTWFLFLL